MTSSEILMPPTGTTHPAASGGTSETGTSWVVAVAAMIGLVFGPSAILVSGFGVLAGPIASSFGWTLGQAASAVSVISLSIVAIAPLQGVLIDRYGARRVVLFSTAAFALSLLAMSRIEGNLLLFHVAWGLMSLAAIGLWPASYLKVVSGWFDKRMGLAIGIANSGIPIGIVIVSPLAAYVIGQSGWRMAFLVLAACVAATFPVLYFAFKERSPTVAARSNAPDLPTARLGIPWHDLDFRLLIAGFFLLGFTGTPMVANLVPLLVSAGQTQASAVALMSVYGIASLAARLLTGALLDRVFASRLMNLYVAGALLASLMLAFPGGTPTLVVATVLLGFIMGAEFDILAYVLRRYFGLAVFGRAFGTIFAVFQCGAALGAATLAFGLRSSNSYRSSMLAFAVALGLSLIAFQRLRAYRIDVSAPSR